MFSAACLKSGSAVRLFGAPVSRERRAVHEGHHPRLYTVTHFVWECSNRFPVGSDMRKTYIRLVAVATILALALPAQAASFNCSHGNQAIHEISAPESWPGTRAAHTITSNGSQKVQTVYTKSGWWDPTWDYYYTSSIWC